MKVALDYDLTYTLDPAVWDIVAADLVLAGHEVRIVTVRSPDLDRTKPLRALEKKYRVHYTNGVAKRWWLTHFGQWAPDVWIDDRPHTILENSTATPADLIVWRATRGEAE